MADGPARALMRFRVLEALWVCKVSSGEQAANFFWQGKSWLNKHLQIDNLRTLRFLEQMSDPQRYNTEPSDTPSVYTCVHKVNL